MALAFDSPRIPNGNGDALWKGRDKSKFNQCECCPYGYHIDLDFVRFCETVSQRSDASLNKERRRERRRQRQSMEVLLGLTSQSFWNLEQQLPKIPQEPIVITEPPDSSTTSALVRDALHRAVQDFEDTLERTHKTPVSHQQDHVADGFNDVPAEAASSGDTSLSSMSAVSSPVTPHDVDHEGAMSSAAHEALLQDFDVASIGSATSGHSHAALQNIRQQMALSLERMRDLEEQVKLIPILQVQLSVAKEEKRKMSLQLRAEKLELTKREERGSSLSPSRCRDTSPPSSTNYLTNTTASISTTTRNRERKSRADDRYDILEGRRSRHRQSNYRTPAADEDQKSYDIPGSGKEEVPKPILSDMWYQNRQVPDKYTSLPRNFTTHFHIYEANQLEPPPVKSQTEANIFIRNEIDVSHNVPQERSDLSNSSRTHGSTKPLKGGKEAENLTVLDKHPNRERHLDYTDVNAPYERTRSTTSPRRRSRSVSEENVCKLDDEKYYFKYNTVQSPSLRKQKPVRNVETQVMKIAVRDVGTDCTSLTSTSDNEQPTINIPESCNESTCNISPTNTYKLTTKAFQNYIKYCQEVHILSMNLSVDEHLQFFTKQLRLYMDNEGWSQESIDLSLGAQKKSMSVQVSPQTFLHHVSIQTTPDSIRKSDFTVQVKPRVCDGEVNATVMQRDLGTSDCTVDDFTCDKCLSKLSTVNVEDNLSGDVKTARSEKEASSTYFVQGQSSNLLDLEMLFSKTKPGVLNSSQNRDSGRHSVTEQKTPTPLKKNVSSNTVPVPTLTKHTDTYELSPKKHSGTNTQKKKLVDVSVGVNIAQPVRECEKCIAQAAHVKDEKEIIRDHPRSVSQDRESRIPRPAGTPVSSDFNKKLKRQITYTKIDPPKEVELEVLNITPTERLRLWTTSTDSSGNQGQVEWSTSSATIYPAKEVAQPDVVPNAENVTRSEGTRQRRSGAASATAGKSSDFSSGGSPVSSGGSSTGGSSIFRTLTKKDQTSKVTTDSKIKTESMSVSAHSVISSSNQLPKDVTSLPYQRSYSSLERGLSRPFTESAVSGGMRPEDKRDGSAARAAPLSDGARQPHATVGLHSLDSQPLESKLDKVPQKTVPRAIGCVGITPEVKQEESVPAGMSTSVHSNSTSIKQATPNANCEDFRPLGASPAKPSPAVYGEHTKAQTELSRKDSSPAKLTAWDYACAKNPNLRPSISSASELPGSSTSEVSSNSSEIFSLHSGKEDLLYLSADQRPSKVEPSKKMKAALKVVNDLIIKSPSGSGQSAKAANDIIQREWFQISSTPNADPHIVEDYLDHLEEMSSALLKYVVNMADKAGNTAMHYALSQGNFDVVSILLDSKVCNINRPNAAGYTAVMLVSLAQIRSETHRRVLQRFLADADVNVRAKQHGQTALMLAVSHNRLDMVQLLIEGGADLNIQDDDGSTALMCAAEHGHAAIVQFLISQPDADQNIKDVDGSTALDIALDAGHKDVGILLYAHKHFSRNNSPYSSLRGRRSKSATPTARSASTPPPRTPSSPLPVRARQAQE